MRRRIPVRPEMALDRLYAMLHDRPGEAPGKARTPPREPPESWGGGGKTSGAPPGRGLSGDMPGRAALRPGTERTADIGTLPGEGLPGEDLPGGEAPGGLLGGGLPGGLRGGDPLSSDRSDTSGNGLSGRRRLDPGLSGARALGLVCVVAALMAGGCLWWSRPRPQPAPASPPGAARPAVVVPPSPAAVAQVVVDVAGKVRRPGVVTLPSGARVIDALRAAGGPRPGARTADLNLARRVADGEQIVVGRPPGGAVAAGGTGGPGGAGPPQAASAGEAPGTPLDLNAATAEQLQQLPGVGPVLAQRILGYRTQHGGFRSVEELRQVSGIGERRFADLKPLLRV